MKLRRVVAPRIAAVAIVILGVVAAGLVPGGIIASVLATEHTCSTGSAVSDQASNPGLVSDCEILLTARDTLAGSATLNWSSGTPIEDWDGVTVGGTPQRVTALHLSVNELSGTIPAELGSLSNLEFLDLSVNELSGTIPAEMGNLSNLTWLDLSDNQLSGTIPAELGSLSSLRVLSLRGNQLSGCIPEGLRDVPGSDLDRLGLPFCGPMTVTVSITATSTQVRIDSPIPVTAAFSEPVSGFTVEDISVVNGSAGGLVGSNGDSVYTFDVTPNTIGIVTVEIAHGDASANLSLGIPYDDDGDGAINRAEVITAIGDYLFSGVLTRDQVIILISLYLFG